METIMILLVALVAGVLTYYINHYLNKGPVFASALVALLAGLLLPKLFVYGSTLAVVATCASYAGMSAKTRITTIWEMGIGALLSGVIFIAADKALAGHGGRLGTIAAIAVITVWGARQAYEKMVSLGVKKQVEIQ